MLKLWHVQTSTTYNLQSALFSFWICSFSNNNWHLRNCLHLWVVRLAAWLEDRKGHFTSLSPGRGTL